MGGGSIGQTANNIVNTVGHTIMHSQKANLVKVPNQISTEFKKLDRIHHVTVHVK
jgi:hypothetical protein